MNAEFFEAIADIEKEKGIPHEYMLEKIEQALLAALRKDHPGAAENARVDLDPDRKEISMYIMKTVVETVENPETEILLDDAKKISARYDLGDTVNIPVETKKFGRIAAQAAKQVIIQGIREAERGIVFDVFTSKEREIMTGIVHRVEPNGNVFVRISSGSETTDAFGHIQMTGTAAYLAEVIHQEIGCKTRAVELSTLQRAAAHLASKIDVDEAFNVGGATVKAADEGSSGMMAVIERISDDPYMSTTGVYDVHRIANGEKVVPREWINKEGNYVTEEFLDYVRPLIQGHYEPMMVEGLPRHLTMDLKNYDWLDKNIK